MATHWSQNRDCDNCQIFGKSFLWRSRWQLVAKVNKFVVRINFRNLIFWRITFHQWKWFSRKQVQQESPPAWTQEAYRPPCSEYSFCCPTWVPPPGGYLDLGTPWGGLGTPPGGVPRPGYPPGGEVPDPGTPPGGYPDLGGGVPDPGTPPGGYPDLGTPPGGTWPGNPPGGVPRRGYPPGGVQLTPPGGVPDPGTPRGGTWPGYPPWGYLTRVPPPGGYLTRVPPGGVPDRNPPSPPCGQTNTCENSTFPSYYVRGR